MLTEVLAINLLCDSYWIILITPVHWMSEEGLPTSTVIQMGL